MSNNDEATAIVTRAGDKKLIKIIVNVKIPHAKPAHHAFIQARGSGTNLARAVKNAVDNFFADKRVKGKRGLMPFTMVVTDDGFTTSEPD